MVRTILDLANTIKETIEEAKAVPLTVDKCFIEREQLLYLIDEVIKNLPDEIEKSKEIMKNSDKILSDATKEAEKIIDKATKKAEVLVSEREIKVTAEAQAKEILLNAKTKSAEIKKLSSDYCNDSLQKTEESLAVILEEVKNTRKKFSVK